MFNKIKFDNYQNLIQKIIAMDNLELKRNSENDNTVYNTTQQYQYDENEAKKNLKKKIKMIKLFNNFFIH